MDAIFMNSENSKTSEPHRSLLNLAYKINLKRSDMLLYQILVCTTDGKIQKNHTETNLKYQLQHGMKSLIYLMDHILYQILKIVLNLYLEKHGEKTDNPSIRIYIN